MRKPIFLLLLLASFILAYSPAAAQENSGLRMETSAGFDGFVKNSGWVPVQVTLSNTGTAVEGTIRIRTGVGRPTFTAPVSLPNQSNKRVSLSIFARNIPSQLEVELLNEEGTIIATDLTNQIRNLGADSLLYGVVSSDLDSLDFLSKIGVGRADVGVALLSVDDLPTDKTSWNDLDVLVFTDADSNQLNAAQREALEAWIGLGGQLVVTGGAEWQKTTAAFSDLLPVTPTGSTSVENLPALSEQTGVPFRDPGPYVITTSTLRDGELLLHQQGIPILARRSFGRGGVFFLSLDPKFAPLDDWDGRESLWRTVGEYSPRTPVWGAGFRDENELSEGVESLPSLALPSSVLIMCFMFAYVILVGPINYIVLSRLNRKELAWFTIPAMIVLFSLVAYLAGFRIMGNRVIVNQLSVAYGRTDAPDLSVESGVGIYSPRRASYDILLEEDVKIRPLDRFGGGISEGTTIARSAQVIIQNSIVDVGGINTFVATSQRPTPDFDSEISVSQQNDRNQIAITVRNNTDFVLEDAILLIGTRAIPIGDLPPQGSITRESQLVGAENAAVSLSQGAPPNFSQIIVTSSRDAPLQAHYFDLLGTTSYFSDREVYPRWKLLESLRDGFNTSPDPTWRPEGIVTLIGWSEQPMLDIEIDRGRADFTATTLYFLELPISSN